MSKKHTPFRQVHLDFHTSPDILRIGSRFSKQKFQEALKLGHIDSITVFAKCHHGLCYYPTKVGTMHPNLSFDLTGAMVKAAHEIGVRAPVYITAGWSDLDAKAHPEWITRQKYGSPFLMHYDTAAKDTDPKPHCSWQTLCLNDGEYAKHIYEIAKEVCERYKDLDGLFFDICAVGDVCYCNECLSGMKKEGLDPENDLEAKEYFKKKRAVFMQKCSDILRSYHPNANIFFNSGGADMYLPEFHPYQTQFEMEDLPTCWGGYDKMSIRAKFFSRIGKPYLGMTGKFHLDWGEFGGFKCAGALKFEIASMALYGAGCSIGDHMHPDGEMEPETYRNIGVAYEYLEKIAPYCYSGKSTARVGVYCSGNAEVDEGLSNILLENQIDYDIICNDDYSGFTVAILPDGVVPAHNSLAKLKEFLANGGKLLIMGDALVENGAFQLDFGVTYLGKSEYDCDYIFPANDKPEGLPDAPMLCNIPAQRVQVTEGEILAEVLPPYFNRTYGHFCGHKNTPHNKDATPIPGIVKHGNIVYVAHSMSKLYHTIGSIYHKRYFIYALKQLYGGGAFTVTGLGSQGRATMIHQPEKHRYCLNMVYAAPVRRGCAEIIEDIMPVFDIGITLDLPQKINRAYNGVSGEELSVTLKDGKTSVVLPKLECHASVVFEY